MVYSFGAVLATGTRIDLSASVDMADPASFQDHWFFIGDCLQANWSNSNVSLSIVGNSLAGYSFLTNPP